MVYGQPTLVLSDPAFTWSWLQDARNLRFPEDLAPGYQLNAVAFNKMLSLMAGPILLRLIREHVAATSFLHVHLLGARPSSPILRLLVKGDPRGFSVETFFFECYFYLHL